jgi:hypothetical protein
MKGQITRHEWEGNYFRKICPYCQTIKEKMYHSAGYRYILSDERVRMDEPKCITVKVSVSELNASASDKAEE